MRSPYRNATPFWYVDDHHVVQVSSVVELARSLRVDYPKAYYAAKVAKDDGLAEFKCAGKTVQVGVFAKRVLSSTTSGRLLRAERSDVPLMPRLETHRLGVYR